jgi:SsrA-binding protein
VAEKKRINIPNKKAGFNYHTEESYNAGMVLTGPEVKSIRANNLNMGDAYCMFREDELFLVNMHISEFKQASGFAVQNPLRERKLLLTKKKWAACNTKQKTKVTVFFPYACLKMNWEYLKWKSALDKVKNNTTSAMT